MEIHVPLDAHIKVGPRKAQVIHAIPVIWHPPQPGCIKINTDGAARGRTGEASCSGVFRDCTGSILGAFSELCGLGTAIEAEIRGVIRAIDIAWSQGVRCIWLECDSLQVVNMANTLSLDHVPPSVRQRWIITLKMMQCMEYCRVSHIYREGNSVADKLANYALESRCPFRIWYQDDLPDFVLDEAKLDASGLARYRIR